MLKIALAQIKVIPGRPDLNAEKMLQFIQQAKAGQADLVLFPEMSIPGYLLGDTWEQPAFLRDCEAWGTKIVQAADTICVLFGNVAIDWQKNGDDGRVRKYNAFFAAQGGQLVTDEHFPYPFRIKTLQPNYREFDDDRHFYSLRKLAQELNTSVEALLQPIRVKIGDRTLKIGALLCEDGWSDDYGIKPAQALRNTTSLDLFVNLSSSPFTLGKNNKRHRVFSRQARDTGVPLVYVNNVGIQNNGKTVYTFDGCSTVYSSIGEPLLHCPPFEEQLAYVFLEDLQAQAAVSPIADPDDLGIDSIFSCLRYGVQNYLAQTGLTKIVIGVSGGIDSAVAAALYAHVLQPENVLLVNMPSQYNSPTTITLAQRLAENLGCRYADIPIEESVALTVRQMEAAGLALTPFMR